MMSELDMTNSCPSCSSIPSDELHHKSINAASSNSGGTGNSCCLGVPHRLQYPAVPPAAASVPPAGPPVMLDGFQMKQSPAWCSQFCTKLQPQFQFFTRLFQNSMLSKPLFEAQQQQQQRLHQQEQQHKQQQEQAAASSMMVDHSSAWNTSFPLHTGMNFHSGQGNGMNFPGLNTFASSSSSSCHGRFPPSSCSFQMSQGPAASTGFMPQKLVVPGEQARASSGGHDFGGKKQQGYLFGKDESALGTSRPPSCGGAGTSGSCLLCHPKMMDLAMMNQQYPAMGIPVLPKHLQFPSVSTLQAETQGQSDKEQHVSSSSQFRNRQCAWPSLRIGGDAHSFQASVMGKVSGEQSLASSLEAAVPPGNLCSSLESPSVEMRSQRNRIKGQWSLGEDKALVKLVKQYGTRRWSLISTFMANRSGKQCRERWVNHLQPDIRKEGWTKEEEELLVQAHSYFGNKWSAIAKMLPGRTDNSIKNHWHAALRKKDRHGKLRTNLLREYIQQKLAKNDVNSPQQQEGTETTSSSAQERDETKTSYN